MTTKSKSKFRFGILGTGWMLGKYAEVFKVVRGATLVAVASRDADRANAAAARFQIPRAHAGYDALLSDPEADVVINALHNGLHGEWSIRALQAGKHVLCEKPLACSLDEAKRMFAAAHSAKRWLMEGFMYRFHPQMALIMQRVRSGDIGRVVYIRSARTVRGRGRENPRYWRDAGGGALMDIGCYCVNFSRMVLSAEPTRVNARAHFDPAGSGTGDQPGVDLTMSTMMEFPGGTGLRACQSSTAAQAETPVPPTVSAQFVCSFEAEPTYDAEIVGTEGKILIPNPWMPPMWPTEFVVVRDQKSETVRVDAPDVPQHILAPFALEIEHFCECVRENRAPVFPPDADAERDSLANMRVLDALAASARSGKTVTV